MDDAQNLRPAGEPPGQREALSFRLAQAQLHGAQAAKREEHVLRARRNRQHFGASTQPLEPFAIGGDEAEQEVGVAGQIFGARLDARCRLRARAAGRTAASPRCCPEPGRRRGRGPLRRSPGCPASRRSASPAPRPARLVVLRPHQAPAIARAEPGIVVGRSRRPRRFSDALAEGARGRIGGIGHQQVIAGLLAPSGARP